MNAVAMVRNKITTPTDYMWGKLRERDHLGDLGLDGRIILRWIFRKWDFWVYVLDLAGSG